MQFSYIPSLDLICTVIKYKLYILLNKFIMLCSVNDIVSLVCFFFSFEIQLNVSPISFKKRLAYKQATVASVILHMYIFLQMRA